MIARIDPSTAKGAVKAPPSKSIAHRLLICAALAEGDSCIRDISDCEDVKATIACLGALGVQVERNGDDVIVHGRGTPATPPTGPLYCSESGSTLRFLIPVAALSGYKTRMSGARVLFTRPLSVYESLSEKNGFLFQKEEDGVTLQGPLQGGEYAVAGNISSQFISGLLFALPLCDENSRIKITTALESKPYIDLTLQALHSFGITAYFEDEHTLYIPGGQIYLPRDMTVEGDESAAAFPYAFNLFGGEVSVLGLSPNSLQGDRIYRKFYPMLQEGVPTLHIGDCPDLGPILFAVAVAKNGGVFGGTHRLRMKESDRAEVMARELRKFGASVTVYEDTVVVYPAAFHAPTEPLMGHNDHRIVMALAVLLTLTGGEIHGAEAVKKSYPDFFLDLMRLGIRVELQEEAP